MEPKFWAELLRLMGLDGDPDLPDRNDPAQWPALRARLAGVFRTRTRAEWEEIFDGSDACVSPVLSMGEAATHPHNVARGSFVEVGGVTQPAPAPRLLGTLPPDLPPPPGWRTCRTGACPPNRRPSSAIRGCSPDLLRARTP
ncbi:CoA transferase [Nonomuraea salmonea]|uniref:CoA transferase n=1 Tax=Nonomuraea salmonea TaxID=46181 RepID=UPI002FECFAED